MTDAVLQFERIALWVVAIGGGLAVSLALAVIVQRIVLALYDTRLRGVEQRYRPLLNKALAGDGEARRVLAAAPQQHRFMIARVLVTPLIANRDPEAVAATRDLVRALSLAEMTTGLLRSRWWWQRALALRAVGLLQARNRTPIVVAALEDPNSDVRDAALDSLADMHDPAALPAIVVHLHNATLQRGRRIAAIAAFGAECEAFLLDLAAVDVEHRLNYARALAICATVASRRTMCDWTRDSRMDVRAAAFEVLGHIGLDEAAAEVAIAALDSPDVAVRARAASALHGWTGSNVASRLGRMLDDEWLVAVQAARSLQSMPLSGFVELQAHTARQDLAGALARQMVWEVEVLP